ncbi:MAG TPA: L-seryl-tRNA(Sec) selenium transferase [Dehalococcoidia bacterium]|nr:L-seryl-tRNA(Sec) selenium transferase [Dehalococcoidia bacterium]
MENKFRSLPSVDKLLSDNRIRQLADSYPHDLLVDIIRQRLEHARHLISQDKSSPSTDEIIESICERVRQLAAPRPRYLINATGVILHTNLGRAPLSRETIAAMDEASKGYCDLEFDLDSGTRGSRNAHIEQLLCQLTGAEAALVVNNNASAVLLGLTALARRKEVIVSRGQAVEIGGGFRVPEVMKQSGSKLVEVGTTNCTYAADFEQAINPRTAALLRVHSSNFKVVGFAEMATLEDLVALGNKHGIPVFDDLGSGCLLDTTQFGLDPEPMVQKSVALGVGLAFFSGDKLLGGPQAGIIVGKKQLVDKLKKHPMARAVRIDKIRLAGLVATLIPYLKGESLKTIPVWRMISAPLSEIERRAKIWAQEFDDQAHVIDGESMIGGGSLPGGTLTTKLVAIGKQSKTTKEHGLAQTLAEMLRSQRPPVVGRISENVLLLDPRSVLPEEDTVVIQALRTASIKLPTKGNT